MLNDFKKKRSIFSESAIYLLSNVASAAIPLLLLPVLTRYLSPEEYGEVALFQTMLGLFGAFVGLSSHLFIARQYYDSSSLDEKSALNGSSVQVIIFSSLMLSVLIYSSEEWLGRLLGVSPAYLYLGVCVCFSLAIIQIRLVCWQVEHSARKYGVMQVGQGGLNFILSLLLVVVLLKSADGRIWAQSAAVFIILVVSVRSLYRDGLMRFFFVMPEMLLGVLKFGIPLMPHVLGGFLLVAVDRLIVNSQLGLEATGVYMVGIQIAAGLALVFDGVNKAFLPWLYERLNKEDEKADLVVVKVLYALVLAYLITGVLVSILLPHLLLVLVGERYSSVGDFIGWLIMGQVFSGVYLLFANFILYSKKTGFLSVASILCGITNVTLLLVLLGGNGVEGAAIAFFVAMFLRMLLALWGAVNRRSMPWLGGFKLSHDM